MPGHKPPSHNPPRARLHGIVVLLFIFAVALAGPTQAIGADRPFAEILRSIVTVNATIPEDARTAHSLGTEREGNGVVIGDDGLVLTIGYLILEASAVLITEGTNKPVSADIVAYDHATGFGLLRAPALAGIEPLPLGRSGDLAEGGRGPSRSRPKAPAGGPR